MQCSETEKYAEDICDAAELELESLDCTQFPVDAANKHFAGVASPLHFLPNSHCNARWHILSARRWLVRIPAKEIVLNALRSPESSDTSDVEGTMDLVYRCVMPAPLGNAIHKVDCPPRAEETSTEDVGTILDINLAAKEAEHRSALWRSQKPTIAVITALALGLRRLRAEVRRRVDAWKIMAASAASMSPTTDVFPVTQSPSQPHRDDPHTPCRRSSFHTAFNRWAKSTGAAFIRSLRWVIPSVESAIERTRYIAPGALNIPEPK